jgi:hypothetical protein
MGGCPRLILAVLLWWQANAVVASSAFGILGDRFNVRPSDLAHA